MISGNFFQKDFQITKNLIVLFAEISGDFNPLHFDVEFAKGTVFKRPIAHGMLTASFISTVIGNYFPGKGTIYVSQSLEFTAPVYANDVITVTIRLMEYKGRNKYKLETTCVNQKGVGVISGYAIVINPNLVMDLSNRQ